MIRLRRWLGVAVAVAAILAACGTDGGTDAGTGGEQVGPPPDTGTGAELVGEVPAGVGAFDSPATTWDHCTWGD